MNGHPMLAIIQQTRTLDRLSWEGPLPVWLCVLVGCLLAAFAWAVLYLVPSAARHRWAPLLLALRCVAIAALVWMVMGPVQLTVRRYSDTKSLAVVVDGSGSMEVIDPPDRKSDLRWDAALDERAAASPMAYCDRAIAALTFSQTSLDRLLEDRAAESARQTPARLLAGALKGAVVCREQLDRLTTAGGSTGIDAATAARIGDSITTIRGFEADDLRPLASEAGGGSPILTGPQQDRLQVCRRQFALLLRTLAEVSDQIATADAQPDAGQTGGVLRREKIRKLLDLGEKSWLRSDDAANKVRQYSFDQTAELQTEDLLGSGPTTKAPRKEPLSTNLSAALRRVNQDAADAGIEAVVLLSDGRHNDSSAENPREVAASFDGLPVYVVPVGTSAVARDLVLHHVNAPTTTVDGDRAVVDAIVSAFQCAGEKCVVELSDGKQVVDRQEVDIASARRDFRIRLGTKVSGVGRHEFSLAVSPLANEARATNNAAKFTVDVIDTTLRLFIADHFPRWEYRYLVNLLERDERIEYENLLFEPTPKGKGEIASRGRLPRDVEGWARYRLVILGDLQPDELDVESQNALRQYISDRGGTVILIAGSGAMPEAYAKMPLGDLLPVLPASQANPPGGFALSLSPEGLQTAALQIADEPGRNGAIWQEMSQRLPVYSLSRHSVPKPTARTLIQASDPGNRTADQAARAYLSWQSVGRGRVIYLAAPTVYQLRLRYGDQYHYRFWGQLIRWAVARDLSQGSKTVKLAVDRTHTTVGEAIQIVGTLSDTEGSPVASAKPRVEATLDGSAVATVELNADPKIPGRYVAEYASPGSGALAFKPSGADVLQLLQSEGLAEATPVTVIVDPVTSLELENTQADLPLLQQIAGRTGGQVVPPTAIGEVLSLVDLEPDTREEVERAQLWNRWPWLWVFVGALCLEWTIRKKSGLP